MVQDMLDPEYYEPYDSQGRSKHFSDHILNDDDDLGAKEDSHNSFSDPYQRDGYSECLSERIPLVVVPIPFASDWLFRGIQARRSRNANQMDSSPSKTTTSTSAVVSPLSAHRSERKRGLDDVNGDEDCSMNCDSTSKIKQQPQETAKVGGNKTRKNDEFVKEGKDCAPIDSINATDWWPAGTCGTSSDDCPILAKMCYDEILSMDEEQAEKERTVAQTDIKTTKEDEARKCRKRPLMLNDVVSLVGVLSMNPWDADFSRQQSPSCTSATDNDFCGWEAMMSTTDEVPPPSRLPRIHVLSYRRVDLDDLALRAVKVEKKHYCTNNSKDDGLVPEIEKEHDASHDSRSDSDDDSEVEWSGFPTKEVSSSSSLASFGSLASPEAEPWIRALWSCLLSKADRRYKNMKGNAGKSDAASEIIRAGPSDRALGCVSLQLSTPDVTSAKSLYNDLAENILPGICPVVARIDLTDKSSTSVGDTMFVPSKDNSGHLKPCSLQLPKGSVLLVCCPPACVGRKSTKNSLVNDDDSKMNSIQTILSELVQHHKVQYRFEGGMMIPFEADYRVIVVTTQTQKLPCTLSALTKTASSTATPMASSTTECTTKSEFREMLVKGRSFENSNRSLTFSSTLLEQAQQDFLKRRQRCYALSLTLPAEDDFHRWLILTKLQTKSRFLRDNQSDDSCDIVLAEEESDNRILTQYLKPSVEDWESALKLDDDLRDEV